MCLDPLVTLIFKRLDIVSPAWVFWFQRDTWIDAACRRRLPHPSLAMTLMPGVVGPGAKIASKILSRKY